MQTSPHQEDTHWDNANMWEIVFQTDLTLSSPIQQPWLPSASMKTSSSARVVHGRPTTSRRTSTSSSPGQHAPISCSRWVMGCHPAGHWRCPRTRRVSGLCLDRSKMRPVATTALFRMLVDGRMTRKSLLWYYFSSHTWCSIAHMLCARKRFIGTTYLIEHDEHGYPRPHPSML